MARSDQPQNSQVDQANLVQALLASTSKTVGKAFFPIMVEALAKTLSVRWVLLSTLHPEDSSIARTVAVWDNGLAANFEYSLNDSPCADILGEGACVFPDAICERYPNDPLLSEMGAVSYVGTPLRSASGEVMGLLAALDDKIIPDPAKSKEILELCSGRTAAEIERLRAASLNERLGRIVEDSVSEVYIFDGDSYQFQLVNRGARNNLGYTMEELSRLTPWDLKPISRSDFIELVKPLRRGEVPTLLFDSEHQRKDGSSYDVAVQLQYFGGFDNVFYASISDVTNRNAAEEARAHLAAIVASSSEAIVSKSLDGIVRSWNQGAESIFGYAAAEIVGKAITLIIPQDRLEEEYDILARIRRGETVRNYETTRVRKSGELIDVSVNISPIFDAAGKTVGASSIAHDISEKKRAEARERLLMGEVNHRAKNLLSLVQVIARQTAASDPVTFARRFEERILAMSASHDVLVNNDWADVPVNELLNSQLGHFRDGLGTRISMTGPPLRINANAAQAVGMALHELATNAAKYGAVSNDDGKVEIAWSLDGEEGRQRFRLGWVERGGPPVAVPSKRGFGSKVIERILQSRVDGTAQLEWDPRGLICRLECPAANIINLDVAPVPGVEPLISDPVTGNASRILVVEDETLLALEIAETLREAGFAIVGPSSSVSQAMALLARETCHAGVLDINLGSETSEAVARKLGEMGLPFVTVSSCSVEERPDTYSAAPHFPKPLRPPAIVEEVQRLLDNSSADA